MDERLRLLGRRAAMSGAPGDEAAELAERLRGGEIQLESVLLAASAGIPAATLALGTTPQEASAQCATILPATTNILFQPIPEQVKVVWDLNQRLGWGFTAEDILSLPVPTAWPDGGEHDLAALVLVPYFDTVQATFDQGEQAIRARHSNVDRWDQLKSDPANLRLHAGITHPGKCLRWEAIDLAANWDPQNGIAPRNVRTARSPHAGMLAVAAIHTKWVEAMDGTTVPYVWLSGYECKCTGRWSVVPWLFFTQDERQVRLYRRDDDSHFQSHAVPARCGE